MDGSSSQKRKRTADEDSSFSSTVEGDTSVDDRTETISNGHERRRGSKSAKLSHEDMVELIAEREHLEVETSRVGRMKVISLRRTMDDLKKSILIGGRGTKAWVDSEGEMVGCAARLEALMRREDIVGSGMKVNDVFEAIFQSSRSNTSTS